jgi:hypothetical protein
VAKSKPESGWTAGLGEVVRDDPAAQDSDWRTYSSLRAGPPPAAPSDGQAAVQQTPNWSVIHACYLALKLVGYVEIAT